MRCSCTLMDEGDAQAICAWRYEGQYAVYTVGRDDGDNAAAIAEMLDRRSPHYAVRNEQGELVGFYAFGTSAQVEDQVEPGLYSEDNAIFIGLGMRPDLVGKGLGLDFINAELEFGREQFAPDFFRLFVLSFNKRAIRAYGKAGFERVRTFMQRNIHGVNEFVEMMRKA